MTKQSRRNFLKLGGASLAGAIAASRFGSLATLAQASELSVQTWGHFISNLNPLLESITREWGADSGVSVEWNYAGFDAMLQTLSTAAATGTGPDMLMLQYDNAHLFAEALADVSDVCEEIGEANGGWYPAAREACVVDGVWRAMPWYFAAHAMVYRTDLFSAAGYDTFPETYEDLLVAGTELKNMGKPLGFALGRAYGDGNCFLFALLWAFGAAVIDADGVIALDSPETRQALEYVQQLYNDAMDPTVVEWDDGTNNRAFHAGEVSCTNNASSIYVVGNRNSITYDDVAFGDVVNHAAYPSGPAGRELVLQIHSFAVPSSTQNLDAAKELLRFINSERSWEALGPQTGAFNYPLFHNYEDDATMPWNFDPKLAAFRGLVADGHTFGYPGTAGPVTMQIVNDYVISDMMASVAVGAMTIDEAVADAVAKIQDIQNA